MVLKAPLHFLFSLHLTVRNFLFLCPLFAEDCVLFILMDRFDESYLHFQREIIFQTLLRGILYILGLGNLLVLIFYC